MNLDTIELPDHNGSFVDVAELAQNYISVFIFMSPDCPLCISYTKTIKDLQQKFLSDSVKFFTVFPGKLYSNDEINEFRDMYDFKLICLQDRDLTLTKLLHAEITPEAVVVNKEEIAYSGAINNWMYETGKKRTVITENYLEDALSALINGGKPDPGNTEAVGCYIEL